MPRIDPQQLLNCLQVLLTPTGGILSKDEVQRLYNLMTKFSKKLVSKCIYVLILKNTQKDLLNAFMGEGGWNLVHAWLQDAHANKNWALVTEVLELLLISPVDVERLKMNNLPKLVKGLTKREDLPVIQQLATTLVDEWLKIVKDVTAKENNLNTVSAVQAVQVQSVTVIQPMEVDQPAEKAESNGIVNADSSLKFKVAIKDGKQVISKVLPESETVNDANDVSDAPGDKVSDSDSKDKKDEKRSSDRSSSRHRSSSSRRDRDRDKERGRDHSKDSKRSSSSSSSSKSSRDKDKKSRSSSSSSKHRSSSTSKSSSSDNKEKSKEKQAEKDKDTLNKIQPQTLQKTGRIPRRNDEGKKEDVKKPSFSVEVRKNTEEKPKTVKIFNSKMRSTGLLEEAKPPPPRTAVKKPPPVLPAVLPVKRPSPIRDMIPPPEKKSRLLDVPERPGSIKLIPPKPKPAVLQESDIFMDALTASATMKKEPKKRKRRPSSSKEASPPTSPTHSSPTNLKNITPANFYQDTLNTDNEDEKQDREENGEEKSEIPDTPAEPDEEMDESVPVTKVDANGVKGVLCYGKKKGPKRSIRWKPEAELVEIQYFELDENERVNVVKNFMDMAKMEVNGEREALRARKLPNEDVMEAQIAYKALIEVEVDLKSTPQVEAGCKSSEKQIQFAREKRVLQAIFFNNKIPDSASEPDPENHPMPSTVNIPLEDPDNPDPEGAVQPWPEPKGSPPHVPNIPPMFQNMQNMPVGGPPFMNMQGPPGPFPPPGPIPPFPPNFMPPNRFPGPGQPEWNGMPPPNMPPPDMMNPGPPMFDNFMPPENGFPPPFPPNNNMPPHMFPPNNNNFNSKNRGRGGGFRRGGNNVGWVRMGGPGPNWNGPPRGAGGGGGNNRGGRLCLNIKIHGYCRNRDNCPFIHPN